MFSLDLKQLLVQLYGHSASMSSSSWSSELLPHKSEWLGLRFYWRCSLVRCTTNPSIFLAILLAVVIRTVSLFIHFGAFFCAFQRRDHFHCCFESKSAALSCNHCLVGSPVFIICQCFPLLFLPLSWYLISFLLHFAWFWFLFLSNSTTTTYLIGPEPPWQYVIDIGLRHWLMLISALVGYFLSNVLRDYSVQILAICVAFTAAVGLTNALVLAFHFAFSCVLISLGFIILDHKKFCMLFSGYMTATFLFMELDCIRGNSYLEDCPLDPPADNVVLDERLLLPTGQQRQEEPRIHEFMEANNSDFKASSSYSSAAALPPVSSVAAAHPIPSSSFSFAVSTSSHAASPCYGSTCATRNGNK